MKLRLTRYYTIAIIVIVVIVGSQAYWLYNSYQSNKSQSLKEINTALKEYSLKKMESFFGTMISRDTTIEDADIEKLKMVQELITGLSKISNSSDEQVTIKFEDSNDTLSKTHLEKVTDDEQLKTLNTEIDQVLKENKIDIEYTIALFNSEDSTRIDMNSYDPSFSGLRSDNISLSHSKHYFHLIIKNSVGFIVKKMSMIILFSAVLILLSVFVFIVFLKTIINQHRLTQLKNDFVNNMTHELKTPLATCSVALEAIEKFNVIEDKDKTLRYIGIAQNEIKRIRMLTDMILTSSAIENKTLIYHFEKINLVETVKNVLQFFELQIAEQKLQINTTFPSDAVFVNADNLHLTNVISNVLDNAIKYNDLNGSIDMLISSSNKNIEITISNTGKGFSKEFENKVFDKFYRISTNDVHNVKGYGLGLNYSKNVIEAHKGSVSIKSEVNKLTVLKIILPVYES